MTITLVFMVRTAAGQDTSEPSLSPPDSQAWTYYYPPIKAALDTLWIVTSHDHLQPEARYLESRPDFFRVFWHVDLRRDLISAGMAPEDADTLLDDSIPLAERWALFYPYFRFTRHIGFAKLIPTALQDLYGIDRITPDTYQDINRAVKSHYQSGWYRTVLEEKGRIDLVLTQQSPQELDDTLYRRTNTLDRFLLVDHANLSSLESRYGVTVSSLRSLLTAMDQAVEQEAEAGAIGIKIRLAYYRTLEFNAVSRHEAEGIFTRKVLQGEDVSAMETKALQDYLMDRMVEAVTRHDLVTIFHTGIQSGNGNFIQHSNPVLLSDLILRHPGARFDLYHGGWPYYAELGGMAKTFPNVAINMNQMLAFPLADYRRALDTWLDLVPHNKIQVFGGDAPNVENIYAGAQLARALVAEVLARKVAERRYTMDDALLTARRLFRENTLDWYGLRKVNGRFVRTR